MSRITVISNVGYDRCRGLNHFAMHRRFRAVTCGNSTVPHRNTSSRTAVSWCASPRSAPVHTPVPHSPRRGCDASLHHSPGMDARRRCAGTRFFPVLSFGGSRSLAFTPEAPARDKTAFPAYKTDKRFLRPFAQQQIRYIGTFGVSGS